ncbi:dihydropteroate synthase [Nitratireductor sp. XY-223]|uniref:dihydropteroate synthase n=1 Tax=Nitratireductor sp. XY-223 TaxID=2561926 RepID=UPI0010A99F4F|nr:dihydropteroate synthase [Nitratireductor sp. XY-223]
MTEAATNLAKPHHDFSPRVWRLAHGRSLELGARGHLKAIVNVTPDSFSDGGRFDDIDAAVAAAEAMVAEGAAIVDIGGESTRPGADPVDAETEQSRVLPVIEALARRSDAILSVDTYRADTARRAIEAGAHVINDVWGLQRDPEMARTAAELEAGLCIMHTGRERQKAADVVEDQHLFLGRSLELARDAGVAHEAIVLDPGFGFAKDADENVELMARFAELHALGHPLVAGTSRKRFIGAVSGRDMDQRDIATASTTAMLRLQGAAIFRVHDIPANKDALAMADAVLARRYSGAGR